MTQTSPFPPRPSAGVRTAARSVLAGAPAVTLVGAGASLLGGSAPAGPRRRGRRRRCAARTTVPAPFAPAPFDPDAIGSASRPSRRQDAGRRRDPSGAQLAFRDAGGGAGGRPGRRAVLAAAPVGAGTDLGPSDRLRTTTSPAAPPGRRPGGAGVGGRRRRRGEQPADLPPSPASR